MKYLQENKDNLLILMWYVKLSTPLYCQIKNQTYHKLFSKLNSMFYTKLRIKLNSMIRCSI